MSNDFTKDLSPYEDNNNNPIRGQYHFDIPQDIEPNAYEMNIDYESHDETKQDAYQYDGWIVVGHRPYFYAEPLIVPYNTLAVSEEAITSYEKFSTSFNAIVKAFQDSALQRIVKNLPYHLRVLKGQFKDYYENPDSVARTNIVNDYNTSSQIINVNMPQSTGSTGTGTTPLKVSNIYESNQTIQNYNTLFARCKGTRDRGTDNYVPGTLVIPLIIGTTRVYIRSLSDASLTVNKNISATGTVEPVAQVCGGGSISLIADIYYQWAMRADEQNDHMKYGYETWRTDPKKQVYVGAVKLQTNINGTWEDVPQSLIVPMNEATTILSDGSIVHTPNKIGRLQIRYTNPLPFTNQTNFKYRWKYIGKVGATFDNTSGELYFETSPDYGTETKLLSRIVRLINNSYEDSSSTIELYKGLDNHLTFYVQLKQGTTYQNAGRLSGVINYTFYGETGTVAVASDGKAVITLPKNKRGIQIELEYIPNHPNIQGYSTTFNIHYSPQETEISFENQEKGLDLVNMANTQLIIDDLSAGTVTRNVLRVDVEDIPITKYKGNQNVPVTGGSLKIGISRRYKENNQIKNLYETNLYTKSIPEDNSKIETNGNMFTKTAIKSLITNMINNKECPFTSYTLHAEYTGSNDFLPKKEYAKLGDIKYTVLSPAWETTIVPRNSDHFYKMDADDIHPCAYLKNNTPEGQREGDIDNIEINSSSYIDIRINATGNYPKHWTDFSSGAIATDAGIPFLKTNVQFIDKDNPTQLANGTTVPANTPIDIPYTPVNTSSYLMILEDGTIVYEDPDAVGEYTDGKTNIDGETIWRIGIPQGWAGKTNVIFRVTLQYKSEVPMVGNVVDIPFSIN